MPIGEKEGHDDPELLADVIRATAGLHSRKDWPAHALSRRARPATPDLRKREPPIMCSAALAPLLLRYKQGLAAAERKTVLDPHRAVTQRTARVQQRGYSRGGEGTLAVLTGQSRAPDAAE
jgi:hypothetical protein